jgi:hypothetical protein
MFLKNAGLIKGNGNIETGLSAQGWEKGIGPFAFNDFL